MGIKRRGLIMFTTITISVLSIVLFTLSIVGLSFVVYYATQYKVIKRLTSNMLYMDDLVDESIKRMWISAIISLLLLLSSVVSAI